MEVMIKIALGPYQPQAPKKNKEADLRRGERRGQIDQQVVQCARNTFCLFEYKRRLYCVCPAQSHSCFSCCSLISLERQNNKMNPLVILAFLATACSAAPSGILAAAPYAAAPLAVAAAPVAVAAPAPYSTSAVVGAPVTTIHQAPAQISKQVHLGQTTYVSGYATEVLKPAIPDLQVAVPTALKGSTQVNPAIVHVEKEIHTVNEPYEVPRPYDVPYDVIKPVEQIVEVPTAVHVAKPVPYAVPTPVRGEPIIQRVVGQPIVRHNHIEAVAQPILAQGAYAIAH